MSLAQKVKQYIDENKAFTLKDLYKKFGNEKKHSVRARLYESDAYKNKKIITTKRGSYLLVGAEIEAIVEHADTREHIFEIKKTNIYYDLIFLDIPYNTGSSIKGGNRQLTDFDLIMAEEFDTILQEATKMLRTEESQIQFMIADGKTAKRDAQKYIRMFEHTGLELINRGSYTKTYSNGKVCNMGKYTMPPELILSYSHSGKERFDEMVNESMDYTFQRPPLKRSGGYATQKPLGLMEAFVQRATLKGEWVLDLFGGSGEMLNASLKLDRKCYMVEKSLSAITDHILPKLKAYGLLDGESRTPTQTFFDFAS